MRVPSRKYVVVYLLCLLCPSVRRPQRAGAMAPGVSGEREAGVFNVNQAGDSQRSGKY